MAPIEYREVCEQIAQKRAGIYGTALSTPASGNPLQIEARPVVDNAADRQNNFQTKNSNFELTEIKGRLHYPGKFRATGHATLYDGSSCVGGNRGSYFSASGGVYKIAFVALK